MINDDDKWNYEEHNGGIDEGNAEDEEDGVGDDNEHLLTSAVSQIQ